MGVVEAREPKSVMVEIWWRGQWDIVRDRRDEGALEIEIIEYTVVYASDVETPASLGAYNTLNPIACTPSHYVYRTLCIRYRHNA